MLKSILSVFLKIQRRNSDNFSELSWILWTQLAILKVIKSYNEKSYIFFFVTKAIHKNKDNCDRKSAEKNV